VTTINDLDGTYNSRDLNELTWPIAWAGTPDLDFEAARAALVAEAREDLRLDPDAVAVEIRGGKVVATVHES